MIYLTDLTLNEALGIYQKVKDLMKMPQWMLRTTATVATPDMSSNFILHAWYTGDLVIHETDHSPHTNASDTDLRELKQWAEVGGWRLCVGDRLLVDPAHFQFWLQKYRETLVYSEVLEKYETDESARMAEALAKEQADELY